MKRSPNQPGVNHHLAPASSPLTDTKMKFLRIILINKQYLNEGKWYYAEMSKEKAHHILLNTENGTFLLRNSFNSENVFALSVKTFDKVISTKIISRYNFFHLDCVKEAQNKIPLFQTVIELVQFYSNRCSKGPRHERGIQNHWCWFDSSVNKHIPIILEIPLRHSVPTLKHLCRLVINVSVEKTEAETPLHYSIRKLPLPPFLKDYVSSYPFVI
ncbi:suppressor of cytokine signaling 2-like [Octopus sinensis]|uniref:Suppressor of cytokine signaling 2-like n=1 Tax=Octopus sinensis TaxID=2607531 RepID=A0A6P7SZF8_9MOLL|nr:suppressor of cytokine signaling 2-like [Octopus sinensis]